MRPGRRAGAARAGIRRRTPAAPHRRRPPTPSDGHAPGRRRGAAAAAVRCPSLPVAAPAARRAHAPAAPAAATARRRGRPLAATLDVGARPCRPSRARRRPRCRPSAPARSGRRSTTGGRPQRAGASSATASVATGTTRPARSRRAGTSDDGAARPRSRRSRRPRPAQRRARRSQLSPATSGPADGVAPAGGLARRRARSSFPPPGRRTVGRRPARVGVVRPARADGAGYGGAAVARPRRPARVDPPAAQAPLTLAARSPRRHPPPVAAPPAVDARRRPRSSPTRPRPARQPRRPDEPGRRRHPGRARSRPRRSSSAMDGRAPAAGARRAGRSDDELDELATALFGRIRTQLRSRGHPRARGQGPHVRRVLEGASMGDPGSQRRVQVHDRRLHPARDLDQDRGPGLRVRGHGVPRGRRQRLHAQGARARASTRTCA